MNVRTKTPIKKATVLPAAMKSKLRFEPYQEGKPPLSLKLQIGELLLFGDSQQENFWEQVEISLRKYIAVKRIGGYI